LGDLKTTPDNQSGLPTAAALTVNANAQNIMTSAVNAGLGTWDDEMNTQNVTLKVPAGNLAGSYQATLTWTLTDAPAS